MTQARKALKTVEPLPERTKQEEKQPDKNVRLHPLLDLQRKVGNQAVLRLLASQSHPQGISPARALRPPSIQTKLVISQSNDPSEQEADRVADQVMRTSTLQSKNRDLTFQQTTGPKEHSNDRVVQPLLSASGETERIQRQTKQQDVDPRCEQKMTEYLYEHWIKELEAKHTGKTCADYEEFKNDVMSKLGQVEFQSFEEGGFYFHCCVKCIGAISDCGPSNKPKRMGWEPEHHENHDREVLEDTHRTTILLKREIPLGDGGIFSVQYVAAQLPPEECSDPVFV